MGWYTAPAGTTCVAAYDAVGAASLADSYTNEANPGTYTAAPGVAPTWAYGTGWTFNGTTQYLTTGAVPASGWSMLVRYSGGPTTGNHIVAGAYSSTVVDTRFYLAPSYNVAGLGVLYGGGGYVRVAPALAAGVIGIANRTGYRNGASEGTTHLAWSGVAPGGVNIGAANHNLGVRDFTAANVQAVAIYSGSLTLADVVAIGAAMNLLPAAAAADAPVSRVFTPAFRGAF